MMTKDEAAALVGEESVSMHRVGGRWAALTLSCSHVSDARELRPVISQVKIDLAPLLLDGGAAVDDSILNAALVVIRDAIGAPSIDKTTAGRGLLVGLARGAGLIP